MSEQNKEKITEGSYAIDQKNKQINITTTLGVSSVLFEDVSSVGFRPNEPEVEFDYDAPTKKVRNISALIFGVGLLLVFLYADLEIGDITLLYIGAPLCVIGLLWFLIKGMGVKRLVETDTVSVETRGGKTFSYTVDGGQGQKDMDAINTARRK